MLIFFTASAQSADTASYPETSVRHQPHVMTSAKSARIYSREGQMRVLVEGAAIQTGDRVETGAGDHSDISISEDGYDSIRILESTRAVFEDLSTIKLEQGSIFVNSDSSPTNPAFQIQTLNASVSERGAAFKVAVENGATLIQNHSMSDIHVRKTVVAGERQAGFLLKRGEAIRIGGNSGEMPTRLGASELKKSGQIKNALHAEAEKIQSSLHPGDSIRIDFTEQAYYITSSCEEESHVTACRTTENRPVELEYQDLRAYEGDELFLPRRFFLPKPESHLRLSFKQFSLVLRGVMIACIDKQANGAIRIKLFESGIVSSETAAIGGRSVLTLTSGNHKGIQSTEVNVKEGTVAVEVPWLCSRCDGTKCVMVRDGECLAFHLQKTPQYLDLNFKVDVKRPKPRDSISIE